MSLERVVCRCLVTINPAGAGGRRHPRGAGGGGGGAKICPPLINTHKNPNPFTSHALSPQRVNVETRNFAHLSEYLAEVVCKFGADPISDDVAVTSEL